MISFSKLGTNYGRFGNQLFQYAFLRTQAERLGVKFYCPKWIGDEIFSLNDKDIRVDKSNGLNVVFIEKSREDYDRSNLKLEDNTEILGNFESEKNFDNTQARIWYSFREDKIVGIKEKYKDIDFSNSIGIHLRLGDKLLNKMFSKLYFVPRINYYLKSIKKIGNYKNLLIFSDNIDIAKEYFRKTNLNLIFIEGNQDWEDLYLMSKCRDFICGNSTLSWWGAWLNNNPKKKVVFPKEGFFRPWTFSYNKDLIPDRCIRINALIPVIDYLPSFIYHFYMSKLFLLSKIGIFLKKYHPFVYKLLKPYFPDKN